MSKDNRLAIKVNSKDKDILEKFSMILYKKIFLTTNLNTTKIGNTYEYSNLRVYSKHMSQQLYKLGVVDRKSKVLTFPEFLDPLLYRHFIRGMIDGDGWIYLPTHRDSPSVGLLATRNICDRLQNIFDNELEVTSCLCKAHKQDVNVLCEIRVKNYHKCKILLDWLYKDSTIHLNRKYEIYQKFLEKHATLQSNLK